MPMNEVGGAVYRIDDECRVARKNAGCGSFLAEEEVGGVFGFEGGGNEVFDCFVCFRYEIRSYAPSTSVCSPN